MAITTRMLNRPIPRRQCSHSREHNTDYSSSSTNYRCNKSSNINFCTNKNLRKKDDDLTLMVVKKVVAWTTSLCAIHYFLHLFPILHDNLNPRVVHAFNGHRTLKARRTTTSLHAMRANHRLVTTYPPRRLSSFPLRNKSLSHLDRDLCKHHYSTLPIYLQISPHPITKRSATFLFTRQSTISDEAAQIETLTRIDSNDFHTPNGHSKLDEQISSNIERNNNKDIPQQQQYHVRNDLADVPTLTVNGGYTHTTSSKAKISAANKGKVPWNKGQSRSEEVKARISEGVIRRNRERFLTKLAMEGITEEQYNERKKEERRKKDADRRARRTPKGGYIPTEETKQKISTILKERYAKEGMKRAPRDPSTVRRGFHHSEETKAKIRESLKRKWAEDSEYRELMTNKTVASGNIGDSVRKRIADTLKKRWEDPEFRSKMMNSFANRKTDSSRSKEQSHRQKISATMKKKWMDAEFRKRATEGMSKVRESNAVTAVMPIKRKVGRMPSNECGNDDDRGNFVQPLEPLTPRKKLTQMYSEPSMQRTGNVANEKLTTIFTKREGPMKRKGKTSSGNSDGVSRVEEVIPVVVVAASSAKTEVEKSNQLVEEQDDESEEHADGCISRMRKERRDLYDLLYGDDDEDEEDESKSGGGSRSQKRTKTNGESNLFTSGMIPGVSSDTVAALFVDDDDLDDFDPYGLHDTSPSTVRR